MIRGVQMALAWRRLGLLQPELGGRLPQVFEVAEFPDFFVDITLRMTCAFLISNEVSKQCNDSFIHLYLLKMYCTCSDIEIMTVKIYKYLVSSSEITRHPVYYLA